MGARSLLIALALFIGSMPARSEAPLYTIENLGHVSIYDDSYEFTAGGINNNGDVVGSKSGGVYAEGVIYTAENGMEDISIPKTFDINDARQIVGNNITEYWDGVYLDYVTGERELISPLSLESKAYGTNSAGIVVGSVSGPLDGGSYGHIAISYEDGVVTQVGALADGLRSTAFAINDNNLIVGQSNSAPVSYYPQHAFSATLEKVKGQWVHVLIDLGTLGGENSSAVAVNNAGQIVGTSDTTVANQPHAFLYEDGVMQDLGALPGEKSYALDINEAGVVLGYSYNSGASYPRNTPAIWIDGELIDLRSRIVNSADWTFIDNPVAINDNGVIVGNGQVREEGIVRNRMYRLTPVTEVAVDVLPGDENNVVYPTRVGKLPVAVLSSPEFDATQVDPATLRFGLGEAAPAANPPVVIADVDGQHGDDTEVRFRVDQSGIFCDDTEVNLYGETYAGELIGGTDQIDASDCEEGSCHAY